MNIKLTPRLRKKLYSAWWNMHRRCADPANAEYKNYGARGIRVCERWGSFEKFVDDMGEPSEGESLDRIDNNSGYEPGNCRWASAKQQSENRRNTRFLTFNGETLCVADWAQRLGVKRGTISSRILMGWSVEKALTTPSGLSTSCKRGHELAAGNVYLYRNRRVCRSCSRLASERSRALKKLFPMEASS